MIARLVIALGLMLAALPVRAALDIEEVTTPGGLTAWLVEDRSLPFVAIDLRFSGGSAIDPPDRPGAVNLMTALLEEGAGTRDASGFQAEAEALAARFQFRTRRDTVAISARMLTENRAESVALLRDALTVPRFDADAVERVRAQVLAGLAQDAQDPEAQASDAFFAAMFGDHPYGHPPEGNATAVAALTADDLRAAHAAALSRGNVHIGVAGDIGAEELAPLLDALLGGLPATGAPLPGPPPAPPPGGLAVMPFDTPQSVAVFGQAAIAEDDPDFIATFVINQIVGGSGFESRLMSELREKRGLTYGVYSWLAPLDGAPLWMGQVASSNATMAQAFDLIREQWADVAGGGVSQAELDAAKTYLTGAYPLRFDGKDRIASILSGMQQSGRPIDYVLDRNAMVAAVTLDDIRRVAGRVMDAEALRFVVVGQPADMVGQ
jgi:zinc protease